MKVTPEIELAEDAHSDLSAEIDHAFLADVLGDDDEAIACLRNARSQIDEWIDVLEKRRGD